MSANDGNHERVLRPERLEGGPVETPPSRASRGSHRGLGVMAGLYAAVRGCFAPAFAGAVAPAIAPAFAGAIAVAFAVTFAATTSFVVAQTPAAVADRLPPPRSVELPALPSSSGPTLVIRRGSDLPRPHLWTLPAGETPRTPVLLPSDSVRKPWRHLSGEPLSLAVEPVPATPSTPVFPTATPARVLDANAWAGTPVLPRFERLADPAPRAQDDATGLPAFGYLTRPVATANPVAPPLVPMLLVDPDAPLRAAAVSNPPLDTDRPATSRETPPRPQFPAK